MESAFSTAALCFDRRIDRPGRDRYSDGEVQANTSTYPGLFEQR